MQWLSSYFYSFCTDNYRKSQPLSVVPLKGFHKILRKFTGKYSSWRTLPKLVTAVDVFLRIFRKFKEQLFEFKPVKGYSWHLAETFDEVLFLLFLNSVMGWTLIFKSNWLYRTLDCYYHFFFKVLSWLSGI